jgi:hypothetical protein
MISSNAATTMMTAMALPAIFRAFMSIFQKSKLATLPGPPHSAAGECMMVGGV